MFVQQQRSAEGVQPRNQLSRGADSKLGQWECTERGRDRAGKAREKGLLGNLLRQTNTHRGGRRVPHASGLAAQGWWDGAPLLRSRVTSWCRAQPSQLLTVPRSGLLPRDKAALIIPQADRRSAGSASHAAPSLLAQAGELLSVPASINQRKHVGRRPLNCKWRCFWHVPFKCALQVPARCRTLEPCRQWPELLCPPTGTAHLLTRNSASDSGLPSLFT